MRADDRESLLPPALIDKAMSKLQIVITAEAKANGLSVGNISRIADLPTMLYQRHN